MALPDLDVAYLAERGIPHEVTDDGNMTCVVFPNWPLPAGYNQVSSTLLLRLQAGYPDIAPDMWWFDPPLQRVDGAPIAATQVTESHLGRTWQRWSRHLGPGQWKSGMDGLESFVALIRRELDGSVRKAA